jgi:lysozyme
MRRSPMRNINKEGEKMLKQWEAFVPFAYDDFDPPSKRRVIKAGDKINGTLTIGYGHTGKDVVPGMRITKEEGLRLLRKDLDKFEAAVERLVKVPLTDNQFAALVSFCYNVGERSFASSTLLRKLNAGDYDAVPQELMKWTKSKGKKLQGLVNRRAAEAGLWARGDFVQSSGSVAEKEKAPVVSPEVVATGTAILSGGGLQFLPQTGPLAWALALVIVLALGFLAYKYILRRTEN